MLEFKKGDILVCVDNLQAEGILTKGEEVVFESYVEENDMVFAMIVNQKGVTHGFFPERFKVKENVQNR